MKTDANLGLIFTHVYHDPIKPDSIKEFQLFKVTDAENVLTLRPYKM